jgi:hypothetical protein
MPHYGCLKIASVLRFHVNGFHVGRVLSRRIDMIDLLMNMIGVLVIAGAFMALVGVLALIGAFVERMGW